ncbi:MAG: MFS transporter [Patescibacteria group bacterium]
MHKVLRILILSDLFIIGSFGLVQPIFAVYMIQNVVGISLTAIGIATTIQLVTKAIMQIIVAKWTDEEPGNRRELVALLIGSVLMSLVSFGYIWVHNLSMLYVLQFLYGLGGALAFPGWVVIYSRYIRAEKAGYEWSVYSTIVSLGTATAAAIGGYMAEAYSFTHLFVVIGTLSLIGSSFISYIFKQEFTKQNP